MKRAGQTPLAISDYKSYGHKRDDSRLIGSSLYK